MLQLWNDIAANFHFLRPMLLLALIPAVALVLLLRYLQGSQSNWHQAIDAKLLPYLLDKTATRQQSWPLWGLLVVWLLGILALAGPTWQQMPVPVQEREDALVIVLDLSLSMYAEDLSPNRAVRAQRKIVDILEQRRDEGQTGLVVYAGDAHAVTPMTDDVETINNLVPSLLPDIMPVRGSKPVQGVALAMDLLENSGLVNGRILLLTDGIFQSDIAEITNQLAGSGHTLSVIGFGTEDGGPIPMGQEGYLRDANDAIVIPRLERGPLRTLASRNGGRYADAELTDADIEALLDDRAFADGEALVEVDREYDMWNEAGPWLLLLALPFAAFAFRRGWLLGLAFVFTLTPEHAAYAWEWQDLWQRKDQRGSEQFSGENFAEAAEQFRDPAWRAAANYRSQNYEQVVQDLAQLDDPESHYNRGNALAHLQQYEAALDAYDRTLAQVPDHADAQHNREIVQRLLEEQQQQEQEQQNQEQQQQQQQDQQQQEQQNQDQQQSDQSQEQQQSEQQEGEQDQQQQQDQQNQEQQQQQSEQQESESEQQQDQQTPEGAPPNTEEEQAMQQWLQRIPDDPGELLRNKFRYQTQQRLFEQLQNPQANQEAADQIW